jgi:cell cycle checkpoint control protein RAD9A
MDTQQNYDVTFNRDACPNSYQVQAKYLRECLDYTSQRAEEFQVSFSEEELEIMVYTREIVADKEVLKQPLQTSMTMSLENIDEYQVDSGAGITVRLKELRTVVNFADALQRETALRCYFYKPGLPALFEVVNPTLPTKVEILFVFIASGYTGDDEVDKPTTESTRLTKRRRVARDSSSVVDSFVVHNDFNQPSGERPPVAGAVGRASTVATSLGGPDTTQNAGQRSTATHKPTVDEDFNQPSVVWDNNMDRASENGNRQPVFRHVSQSLLAAESESDDEVDRQLTQIAEEVGHRSQRGDSEELRPQKRNRRNNQNDVVALGPTQGASQARGLFD